MQTLKFKDGQKIEMPSCQEEITLAQYIQLSNADLGDIVEVFSIFTGLNYLELSRCKDDIEETILRSLLWYVESDLNFIKYPIPEYLKIGEQTEEVGNIGIHECKLRQKMFTKQELIKNKDNTLEAMPMALSYYLQPIFEGEPEKDARKKAEAFNKKVLQLPAFIAVPLAGFFLTKSKPLKKSGIRYLLQRLTK